jgi:hypothetical protein
MAQHPRWAASLFDEHFLRRHAAPLLRRRIDGGSAVAPEELGAAYVAQLYWPAQLHEFDFGGLTAVAADFLRSLDAELGPAPGAAGGGAGDTPTAAELRHVLAVYAEALRTGSDSVMDWLWLASSLPRPADQRYCLERVLQIDPGHVAARRALAQLEHDEAGSAGSESM